jgi:signal transduction histidine kinase
MGHRGRKGYRALLSAFFALFLPAALIGLLAMGMVAGQKKVRQSEIRDSWRRDIGRGARRLEAEIEKRVKALFGPVSTRFTPSSDRPAFIEALKTLFVENKDVSYPFLFSPDGEMLLPRFGNSRAAIGRDWLEKWAPPVSNPLWSEAENIEFSKRNPLRAIPLYLALEARIPRDKLPDLHLAVSRCYFKAGERIQAREYGLAAWQQLASAPMRRDRLDLYVLRQLGFISMRMELPQEAFSYYLRIYEALASRPDELAPDLQFLRWEALDFLKNNRDIQPYLKKERIEEIDSQVLELYRGEISLFSDLAAPAPAVDRQPAERDRFLKLKEIFDPETSDTLFYRSVQKRFFSWRPGSEDHALHFRSGIFQQSPFLLAFSRLADRADGSSFYFGCRLQLRRLFRGAWPGLLSFLNLPRGAVLLLYGPNDKLLPGSECSAGKKSVMAVQGQGSLTGWTFRLQADDSRIFSNLASRALRWYHALIAALFASLGLGIILLLRYLGNEKKLLRQKAEFVDMTSHTLKTPLTRLRLLAEKLEQGWTTEPGRAGDHCRAIADETANMAQLVDRMLDFSALQAGRASYCFGSHSVREWLEGVLQRFELQLGEKGFQVELEIAEDMPPARIDPEAMGTALSNLLENALQHATDGRYLGIAASADGNELEIAIEDHGPGIPGKDRERLFDPIFHGSGAGKRKGAGRGLGLAICRGIVEAHGGTIRAESVERSGARFVITLPSAGS